MNLCLLLAEVNVNDDVDGDELSIGMYFDKDEQNLFWIWCLAVAVVEDGMVIDLVWTAVEVLKKRNKNYQGSNRL